MNPRFVLTPAHPDRPRGKWFIWDHAKQTRHECYGEDEAKGIVARIRAAEVAEFMALETGKTIPRNRHAGSG